MKKRLILLALMAPLFTACTAVKVEPLAASHTDTPVCIVKNDDVIVPNFLNVVQNGFNRHDVDTKVFRNEAPKSCNIILTYTALRSWDIAPYLSHAEIWLRKQNGEQIAYAQYHIRGGSVCLALNKWASVESKMDPVMDKLLANYK